MELLGDNNRTIFSNPQSHSSEERAAIKKGEERGKRGYEAENPKCGTNKTTAKFRTNYDLIDWSAEEDGE